MAIQTGFITLRGKRGNTIYYEREGKKVAREAPEKVTQTEASKKAAKDFGRSASATALIRKAFAPLTKGYSDSKFIERLKRTSANIIHTGPKEMQGKLEFTDGDVALLKSVEFNMHASLAKLFKSRLIITLDKTDSLNIKLPKMAMKHLFKHPAKAVKAKIELMCATFHFDLDKAGFALMDDIYIPLNIEEFNGLQCDIPLQSAENSVLAVALNLGFTGDDGLVFRDRRFYAGKIVEVFNIKDGNIVEFKYPEKVKDATVVKSENRISWRPLDE